MTQGFLPVCEKDMRKRGWDCVDFVYVSGDAYVDHSSFGMAIITRVLESRGYRVGIIAQPDRTDENSVCVFGEPRLGFLVSAGNMDSMVNHYTVNRKRRSSDAYSPGGKTGLRPDNATIVYCNLIKRKYRKKPVIIGGVEASLRRLGHYDYWSDRVKRSVLLDSGADLLMYGMGELSVVEIADALDSGMDVSDITYVRGTVFKTRDPGFVENAVYLPDFDMIASDKRSYAESTLIQYRNTDYIKASALVEKYGENRYVVQNPPQRPLTVTEMDDIYELPYMNTYHPVYEKDGGVPAIKEVRFSLTSSRGCFGGCNFCSLVFHQGRSVQVRSHESLVREAVRMTSEPDFKGYIHDVGGPTADFRHVSCESQCEKGMCRKKKCLFPVPCRSLDSSHSDYTALLKKLAGIPGIKKVFVRSGIRFDYVMSEKSDAFMQELVRNHISGQLRAAPEHVSDRVLSLMGKPSFAVYRAFAERFARINEACGKEQYLLPYFISSHPGSRLEDAVMLAEYIRDLGYMPEQVQDFYPTPMTISTCMYYTGLDPFTMEKVYVPKGREKAMQRALVQYRNPENYDLVKEALLKAGRRDLIGFDSSVCLILPRKIEKKDRGHVKGRMTLTENRRHAGGRGRDRKMGRERNRSR